jgi:transposase
VITIGIDPHKYSLTAVALDQTGRLLATRRIVVNAAAYKTLTGWAARWPQRRFAVEGAAGLGRGIAQLLAAAGEDVVDVPATLAARARLLDTGGTRKTDAADAASVAHAAQRQRRLRPVVAEDHHTRLRLLSERRDDLAGERVRLLNRLHVLLRDLIPGGAALDLTADKAALLLRGIRPITATDNCRRDLAQDLIADLRQLDRRLHTNEAQIRQILGETHSTITTIRGVGHIIAAKVLGHVGDITRFPTADHLASYAGTAPLEASSGERRRHRLNPTGNRQLNTALHTIAPHPSPRPRPRPRLLPTQTRRGQDTRRSSPRPQTPPHQRPLPPPRKRSTEAGPRHGLTHRGALEPLPTTVAGGRTPNESHTLEPWTAANESNPPATSTQPGHAELVDQIKQVADKRLSGASGSKRPSPGTCKGASLDATPWPGSSPQWLPREVAVLIV